MVHASQSSRRAVIDIGTNSVKLLVADVVGGSIEPVLETSEQTRLGRGFYDTHILQKDSIQRTASAVAAYTELAREQGAEQVFPFATSAARDAKNAEELVLAVQSSAGLKLTIISGETEAEWAFQGASTNPQLGSQLLLLMDVGGGSTEFTLGQGGRHHFSQSYRMGTVRLLEAFPHSDPPAGAELDACRNWIQVFLQKNVQSDLTAALNRETQNGAEATVTFLGTGGTATILAAIESKLASFDRERIESARISVEAVCALNEKLWSLPLVERQRLPGLPPPRADVMLIGTLIFESVMKQFGFNELRVSTRGLRFAALTQLWKAE